jgi:hypothetical protein
MLLYLFDPSPLGFDEELARVVAYSSAVKAAIPDVLVAAPSTCAWWFCKYILDFYGPTLIVILIQTGRV